MSWRPRFTASHLSWTTCPELQHLAVVKVHGVFPSNHGYSASSPRLQFHRIPRRDSAQVVAPFVQVGTSCSPPISGGTDYPFTLSSRAQGPASDHARRFARRQETRSHVQTADDQSLRGQEESRVRDTFRLPTGLPFRFTTSLRRRIRGGLPRY